MRRVFLAAALIGSGLAAAADAAAAGAPTYRVSEHWHFGGGGGWDYLSVDADARRLYVARATHVAVVDLTTGQAVADIPDTAGVHGIALATQLHRGFISCGKSNLVKVFDLQSHAVIASIAAGDGPDAILYEPVTQRVFAFDGRGHAATVIDARTLQVVATLSLGGKPEEGRADGQGTVFVNIEDKAELARLDARAGTLTGRWPLPDCEEPTGLALDVEHHRGFSTCSNARLVVMDLDSGKAVSQLPIGHGVDGADFDAASQLVFASNGEGTLTIVREADPNRYAVVQTLATERGARTLALDAQTHRLYLPTAPLGAPGGGDFEVLVVQPP